MRVFQLDFDRVEYDLIAGNEPKVRLFGDKKKLIPDIFRLVESVESNAPIMKITLQIEVSEACKE